MGVFEKLKNALFEEEYVEVEEKPKKVPKKEKVKSKGVIREKAKEEKPIAKKVVLPGRREVKVVESDEVEEEALEPVEQVREPVVEEVPQHEFKFMAEEDFQIDNPSYVESEPKIVKVLDDVDEKSSVEPVEERVPHYREEYSYSNQDVFKERSAYGGEKDSSYVSHRATPYEKKEERTYFKPSPIISPIYGILDKNYRKEDVVSKKDVRHTSSYVRENVSVDDVRNKAYGNLSDDIARDMIEVHEESVEARFDITDDSLEDNLLVDLSKDDEKPEVKEVTMGDAVEYFQDLGLEYNVDYKDASKERVTGRRVKADSFSDSKTEVSATTKKRRSGEKSNFGNNDIVKEKISDGEDKLDIDSDDNLFDLIDSMYQEDDQE